jgi:hypothetical protein
MDWCGETNWSEWNWQMGFQSTLAITDSTSFHNYNRTFLLGKNPILAFSLLDTIIGICSKHICFGDKIYVFILVCETQIKIYWPLNWPQHIHEYKIFTQTLKTRKLESTKLNDFTHDQTEILNAMRIEHHSHNRHLMLSSNLWNFI